MASLINPTNIDVTYPIAGQDNDTQGFRDNFNNIKNNLTTAKNEITAIQAILDSSPSLTSVPASATDSGSTGQIAFDASWLYACIDTDTWVRTPVSTWPATLYGNTTVAAYLATGNITMANLTITSTIQFANLTTTQINTISTPTRGMTVYNYNTGNVQVYNGTKWANVTLS
jgi:hypothetical protein